MTRLLALAVLLLAAGPAAARTFVFGLPAEPVQLDPAVASDSASLLVTHQLFEGLVRLKGATTEIEPALAERWETSPDGIVWTFHLRKGVRFHDGEPLDAAAVAWNFGRWSRSRHRSTPTRSRPARASSTGRACSAASTSSRWWPGPSPSAPTPCA